MASGAGVQTSDAFAAAVDNASRFKRSRTGRPLRAGSPAASIRRARLDGRITKQGESTVRKLLYKRLNSILTRTKQSLALKTWALKIAKRRGLRKARVALARRRAVIMHAARWYFVRDLRYGKPARQRRCSQPDPMAVSREGAQG